MMAVISPSTSYAYDCLVTESQWIGLACLGIAGAFFACYVVLLRRRRTLGRRGESAVGRVLSVTRESYEGGRGWISTVEFFDASGTMRQFEARGRFEGEVGVSYDPKRPARARVTTSSPYPPPARWRVALIYAGLTIVSLMWLALLVSGVLLIAGIWELSDEALFGALSRHP